MHDHPEHHPFEVEADQPDNRNLAVYGVAVALIFFGCGITLTSLFHRASDVVITERSSGPALELRELHAREDAELTSYGWVDKDKGVARIPIDQAMKLMVEGKK